MLVPNDMEGKLIGVLGLGASGRAAVDELNTAGADVFSFDDMKSEGVSKKYQFFHWRHWHSDW